MVFQDFHRFFLLFFNISLHNNDRALFPLVIVGNCSDISVSCETSLCLSAFLFDVNQLFITFRFVLSPFAASDRSAMAEHNVCFASLSPINALCDVAR